MINGLDEDAWLRAKNGVEMREVKLFYKVHGVVSVQLDLWRDPTRTP